MLVEVTESVLREEEVLFPHRERDYCQSSSPWLFVTVGLGNVEGRKEGRSGEKKIPHTKG